MFKVIPTHNANILNANNNSICGCNCGVSKNCPGNYINQGRFQPPAKTSGEQRRPAEELPDIMPLRALALCQTAQA